MAKVTGIGGIFIKSHDHEATKNWYLKHLGIDIGQYGAEMHWSHESHPAPYSLLSLFKPESDYFAPSQHPFMLNFRVDDLEALVTQLRADGVDLVVDPVVEEYGKFAWVIDPNGIKIELWEQPA
jgi:predicted enzyme related to lactoylglutathione lyase